MHFSEHYYFRLFLLWPILQFSTQHLYNSVRFVYKLDFNYSSSSQRRCPTAAQENRENYHNRNVALQRLSGAFFFPLSFTLSKVFFFNNITNCWSYPVPGKPNQLCSIFSFHLSLFLHISLTFFSFSLSLSSLSLNTRSDTHILNPLYIHHVL